MILRRRAFLELAGGASMLAVLDGVVGCRTLERSSTLAESEIGQVPLASLRASLGPDDALILAPGDPQYAAYQAAYNRRTALAPQVRILCRHAQAVATTVQWARANQVAFATRGGGHSYEGFSQSRSVVIDQRLMKSISLGAQNATASVGAGAALGEVYAALGASGVTIPAGSCPTVGVTGHTLGGGFGLLSRPLGLACDSLVAAELIDPAGNILQVNAVQRPDLFWALRGGGGGSFGVVTNLEFKTHPIGDVVVFGVTWVLPASKALRVMQAWQSWIGTAPSAITSIFRITKDTSGKIRLRFAGQSTGTQQEVQAAIDAVCVEPPTSVSSQTKSFLAAVAHFGGGAGYETVYMKGKSDYLFEPMNEQGISTIFSGLQALPAGAIAVICDSYGGAVGTVAGDATAFAHRRALFSVQYYSQWSSDADNETRLARMRTFHVALRPFVSGAAYLNYPDLELPNYAEAYWGANLPRLRAVKAAFDPENVFRHAQSVPLG